MIILYLDPLNIIVIYYVISGWNRGTAPRESGEIGISAWRSSSVALRACRGTVRFVQQLLLSLVHSIYLPTELTAAGRFARTNSRVPLQLDILREIQNSALVSCFYVYNFHTNSREVRISSFAFKG